MNNKIITKQNLAESKTVSLSVKMIIKFHLSQVIKETVASSKDQGMPYCLPENIPNLVVKI